MTFIRFSLQDIARLWVCLVVIGFLTTLLGSIALQYCVLYNPTYLYHLNIPIEHNIDRDRDDVFPSVATILLGLAGSKNYTGSFDNVKLSYLIEPINACNRKMPDNDENLSAVIFVTSAPTELGMRSVIRRTWANVTTEPPAIDTVFVLGLTKDEQSQSAIDEESKRFGDILQIEMVENYKSLAWKTYLLLNWAATRCSNVKFIIKADTDTVVLKIGLDTLRRKEWKKIRTIWGSKRDDGPIRDPNSKWYASYEAYNKSTYPAHCSGSGYVMTGDTPALLVAEAKKYPVYFHLEDVMFTGIAAENANVSRLLHHGFVVYPGQEVAFCDHSYITRHLSTSSPFQVNEYWEKYLHETEGCRDKR